MNDLEILARKYGTDKRTNDPGQNIYHGYTDIYYEMFKGMRNEKLNIVEIGVQNGYSTFMFRDFFPNAMIYGIDTFGDIGCKTKVEDIEGDRIKILVADQSDEAQINKFFTDVELDLILDDGSHLSKDQQNSFRILFPKLKSGGYYIIEDLSVCLNRSFREFDDIRSSTLYWLQLVQKNIPFSYYIDHDQMVSFIQQIQCVSINGELGIIKKL